MASEKSEKPPPVRFTKGAEFHSPEEVFEISDFTVVTPAEQFSVHIESVLQEWGLAGGPQATDRYALRAGITSWQSKSEKIQYGKSNFLRMTYFWPDVPTVLPTPLPQRVGTDVKHLTPATNALIAPEMDFCHLNNITAMFAAFEYVLISPWHPEDDQITTEDQRNTIISAYRMAALSCECEIPVFVQYGHADRLLFFGAMVNHSTVTLYEVQFQAFQSAHLRSGQRRHSHLSGLLALFKEKVRCPISLLDAVENLRVSAQVEFTRKITGSNSPIEQSEENVDFTSVPFGFVESPLESFTLIARWPNMREDMITETETFSDLGPMNAFTWAGKVQFRHVERFLSGALHQMLSLARSNMSGDTASFVLGISSKIGVRAFGQLTDGIPMASLRIGGPPAASITNPGGLNLDEPLLPLPKQTMLAWIDEIFGLAGPSGRFLSPIDETFKPIPGIAKRTEPTADSPTATIEGSLATATASLPELEAQLRTAKAAPPGSLTTRFGNAFAHSLVAENYGPTTFAQVWYEFVGRLRYYYENNKNFPGMSHVEFPDLSASLLQQKIEMLQCCIRARKRRHALYEKCSDFANEEFYDAEEDVDNGGDEDGKRNKASPQPCEPQGRLYALDGDARLRNLPDIPIYVPITQDRAPMTEDMVEAHAKYLSSLGESEERVEAQLDTLRSDMQAFKAANPGCCVEDFIRWHSPKDLIWDDEQEKFVLSERMQLSDNTWLRCWKEAQPVSVVHQTRLFNESKIAEEILMWLENATVRQMTELLSPVIFAQAARQLTRDANILSELVCADKLVTATVSACRSGTRDDFLEALREIRIVENVLLQYKGVKDHLNAPLAVKSDTGAKELHDFVVALIQLDDADRSSTADSVVGHGVAVVGGPNGTVGEAVRHLMQSQGAKDTKPTFPKPSRRQYVMRWLVPRPTEHSLLMPQRLFASLEDEEFRLCGAFSTDATFC